MDEQEKFETAIAGFIHAAQTKVNEWFALYAPLQSGKIVTESGPKYIRVICESLVGGKSGGRSAYCFIDRTNGNVLKPAGWRGPEKKNPRSNIFSADFGASGITGYGTVYLK